MKEFDFQEYVACPECDETGCALNHEGDFLTIIYSDKPCIKCDRCNGQGKIAIPIKGVELEDRKVNNSNSGFDK